MSPKRAPKAPPAPARSPAKKAPRPASTKKKEAPPKPAAKKELTSPNQKPKPASKNVTQQLSSLLQDLSAPARSIVDFVVGPICGLESLHKIGFSLINATPFLLAVYVNRLDVVQLLVAHSVNTKAASQDNATALHIASRSGQLEMVRYLVVQCGLDVHAVDKDQRTSLHWAIIGGNSNVALLLLEHGADPYACDASKCTPLHWACYQGLVDVAQVLMQKNANIDAVDRIGRTPLHLAISNYRNVVALLLLELGADPNHSDDNQWTPLHWACCNGLVDVAQVLIKKGASTSALRGGETPLDFAISSKHSELALLLGARP